MKFALVVAVFVVLFNVESIFGITCGENEEESQCHSVCIARCPKPETPDQGRGLVGSGLLSGRCPTICLRTPVCVCKGGFLKARTGKCVLLADCKTEEGLLGLGVVG
ncbi:hypothetical protein quinque_004370 [Culex quinquefasciatus]